MRREDIMSGMKVGARCNLGIASGRKIVTTVAVLRSYRLPMNQNVGRVSRLPRAKGAPGNGRSAARSRPDASPALPGEFIAALRVRSWRPKLPTKCACVPAGDPLLCQ